MNFLVTGGCGYIGTLLTKHLLSKKNKVTVVDNCWFGNFHKKSKMLKVIKKDIRNFEDLNIKGVDTIIHLANIANDPTVELDPTLSWDVNVLASKLIARHAIKNKVKKIIFLSSGSVYGVKKEKKVTENLKLNPISIYNKTKMIAERVFLSFKDKIDITCIRPATVCGFSERLRLDLTVNKLTYDAFYKKKIFVAFQNRYNPSIKILKNFLNKKKFGKIITISSRLRWCRYPNYYKDDWHGTWKLDGGVLANQAIHILDILLWFFGPVKKVFSISKNVINKLEAEDTIVSTIEFSSGVIGTLEATTACRPSDYEVSLSVIGEKGVVELGGLCLNKIRKWSFINSFYKEKYIKFLKYAG